MYHASLYQVNKTDETKSDSRLLLKCKHVTCCLLVNTFCLARCITQAWLLQVIPNTCFNSLHDLCGRRRR